MTSYERGILWAKTQLQEGVDEDSIRAYLDCSDDFDRGARDYLNGRIDTLSENEDCEWRGY